MQMYVLTDDLIVKNHADVCTNTDDLVKNHAEVCTNRDDLVKIYADACTNTDSCTNENDDSDDDSDSDSDDDKPGTSDNNDNKPGTSGNIDNNDNKPNKNDNKDNKDNKPVNNDNDKEESHQISPGELLSNNIAKIIKLVDELENDEIYDDDEWLVFMQLNMINLLLDELIDHVWLSIYNKNREKNEIINIDVDIDKQKDIEGYLKIYKKIIDDKFESVNKIVELYNNAIDKKEFNNLKDDVLKLIGTSSICDVERKVNKKDNNNNNNNNKKDSGAKRKVSKKDNSKNVNKDKDKDNLIDKLLNDKDKDKLHNFSDQVLNNLTNIAKLKEKILINKKKAGQLSLPIKNVQLKLDNYKKINILYDDLINHVWRMIFGKNRVNNEMDNIDCNVVEDAKTNLTKYIKIVNEKQVLIYFVSESIDELMEGLDENSSNDIAKKEIKDFKKAVIKSIDKFLSYIKLETKKKGIEKKDIEKEHIEKVNDKNSVEKDTNNKPAANVDITAHIKNKQKLIKQRFKSLLKTKKTIKIILN